MSIAEERLNVKVYVDIYRGFICKNLNVQFIYSYENNPESKYKTYSQLRQMKK